MMALSAFQRQLIGGVLGVLMVALGIVWLTFADHAQANAPPLDQYLPETLGYSSCLACSADPSLQNDHPPSTFYDPCDACHLQLRPPSQMILGDIERLQGHILSFGRTANTFQKQDQRYKLVLEDFQQAKAALRSGSLEIASAYLHHANDLLAQLENEGRSGYWVKPQKTAVSVGLISLREPLPVVHSLPVLTLTRMEIHLVDSSPALPIRLLWLTEARRRGPPERFVFLVESKWRLPLLGVQSPFCFCTQAGVLNLQPTCLVAGRAMGLYTTV
jgi:hypothetical protein